MDRDYNAMYQRLAGLMEELEGVPGMLEEAGNLMQQLKKYYYSEAWREDREKAEHVEEPFYGEDEFLQKVDEASQYTGNISYSLEEFRSAIDTRIDDL